MAIEDILSNIKKETEKRIKELEKDLKEKQSQLEKKYERKQKSIDESMHKKIETQSSKILEKAETLASMEHKIEILKAKRQLIEETLDDIIEKLATADNYGALIADMIKKTTLEGDSVVVIPAKGKEEETKKAIKSAGKEYFLSEKSGSFKGGFILKTDKIEIDNSFETLIKEQLREELEIELAKLLFQ